MILEKLNGIKATLVDDNIIEEFTFGTETVSATIGTQDGAVCAPILNLKENINSSITIEGQGFAFQWNEIQIQENQILVNCNGKPSTYIIS